MNLDTLKMPMARIYYLANTPTYIYRNIVSEFTNMNLQSVLEADLDVWESSISEEDSYLLYLAIYIRIINEYKFDEARYKNLKWHEEFISYCRAKQTSTLSYSLSMGEDYTSINTTQEVTVNAQD